MFVHGLSEEWSSLFVLQFKLGVEDNNDVTWKDPNTGEYFVIDQRAGNSYPRTLKMVPLRDHLAGIVHFPILSTSQAKEQWKCLTGLKKHFRYAFSLAVED